MCEAIQSSLQKSTAAAGKLMSKSPLAQAEQKLSEKLHEKGIVSIASPIDIAGQIGHQVHGNDGDFEGFSKDSKKFNQENGLTFV